MKTLFFFIFLLGLVACTDNGENIEIDSQNKNLIDVYKNNNFEFLGRIINDSLVINNDYKFNALQINYDSDTCKILHYLGTNNSYQWNNNITISSLSKSGKSIKWNKINCTLPIIPKNPYDLRFLSSLEIQHDLAVGRLSTATYPPYLTAIKIFSNDHYIRNFNLKYFSGDISENDVGLTYSSSLRKIIVTTLKGNYEQEEIHYNSPTAKSVYNFVREKGKNDHVLISGLNVSDSTNYLLLLRLDLNNLARFNVIDSILINPFCTNCKPIRLENIEKKGDDWFVFEAKRGYKEENIIVKIENGKLQLLNTILDCSGINYGEYGKIALYRNKIYAIKNTYNKNTLQCFENGSWSTFPNPNFEDFDVPADLQVQFIKSTPKGLVITFNGELTSNTSKKSGILDAVLLSQ